MFASLFVSVSKRRGEAKREKGLSELELTRPEQEGPGPSIGEGRRERGSEGEKSGKKAEAEPLSTEREAEAETTLDEAALIMIARVRCARGDKRCRGRFFRLNEGGLLRGSSSLERRARC